METLKAVNRLMKVHRVEYLLSDGTFTCQSSTRSGIVPVGMNFLFHVTMRSRLILIKEPLGVVIYVLVNEPISKRVP